MSRRVRREKRSAQMLPLADKFSKSTIILSLVWVGIALIGFLLGMQTGWTDDISRLSILVFIILSPFIVYRMGIFDQFVEAWTQPQLYKRKIRKTNEIVAQRIYPLPVFWIRDENFELWATRIMGLLFIFFGIPLVLGLAYLILMDVLDIPVIIRIKK